MSRAARSANAADSLHPWSECSGVQFNMSDAMSESPNTKQAALPLVLVAEDHEDNLQIAVTILHHAGYRTALARDGAEAVRLARALRPDLVLMDIGLPVMDGWTAARTLRDGPDTRHIVIVACTAHALEEDEARATTAGCDAYITKPIPPLKLLEVVRTFLPAP